MERPASSHAALARLAKEDDRKFDADISCLESQPQTISRLKTTLVEGGDEANVLLGI